MEPTTEKTHQAQLPLGNGTEQVDAIEPETIDVEVAPLAVVEQDLVRLKANIEGQLQRSQMMVEFQSSMRRLVVANARPDHWIRFGHRVRPDISECIRLRMLFGVDINLAKPERSDHDDEGGKYYIYLCSGTVGFGPIRNIPCFGGASSRTKFFSKSHGDYLDSRDINPAFVAKMAWSEAFKNGIVALFGLDVDPEELTGITGRTVEDTAKDFDHSKSDTEEVSDHREFIRNRILELAKGDKAMASGFLQDLTTFKAKDGKWVKGKKTIDALTQKQVANLFSRAEKDLTDARLSSYVDRKVAQGA